MCRGKPIFKFQKAWREDGLQKSMHSNIDQTKVSYTDWLEVQQNLFFKKNGDLKNSKISTKLSNVGFVWQGKR